MSLKHIENKVFVLSSKDDHVTELLESNGGIVFHMDRTVRETKISADIAVFIPGADVTPFLYGARKMSKTQNFFHRDIFDNDFYRLLPPEMPKIGIGRGAQFLNVMAGGTLYQHVTGHTAPHSAVDLTLGQQLIVQSSHHQAMIPPKDADILLVASAADTKTTDRKTEMFDHVGNLASKIYPDVEATFNPKISALCFQPRPDIVKVGPTSALFFRYIDNFILPLSKKTFEVN